MGARFDKFAGIAIGTVKDLFSNNFSGSGVVADDEVLSAGFEDTKNSQSKLSVSDSATELNINKTEKPRNESSRIYGESNRFSESSSCYGEKKTVEFCIAPNAKLGVKETSTTDFNDSFAKALVSSRETNRETEQANKRTVIDYAYGFTDEPVQAATKKTIVLQGAGSANSIAPSIRANDGAQAVKNSASIGFGGNTVTTRNTTSQYQPADSFDTQSFSPVKSSMGGIKMGSPIQLLTPNDINEANQLGELLNMGNTVLVMLTNIKDKTARIRYSDYMTGCCGGCGATFKVIVPVESPDSVLLAAPKGVQISLPKQIVQQQQAQAYQQQMQQMQSMQPMQQPAQQPQRSTVLPTFTPDDLFRVDDVETTDIASFKL